MSEIEYRTRYKKENKFIKWIKSKFYNLKNKFYL